MAAATSSADAVTETIPVDNEPVEVAVGPDGTRTYVTNFDGNTVSVISL